MDQVGLNGLLRGSVSKQQRIQYQGKSSNSASDVPRKPIVQPMDNKSLSQQQAAGLKVLQFAGRNFKPAAHLQLEADFINDLKTSTDATEKTSLAEMLGRAHSINALPALTDTLGDKQPVQARTAAALALGEIGDSTHKDSFTRTQLADTLIDAYNKRKGNASVVKASNPMQDLFAQLFGMAPEIEEDNEAELLNKELEAIATALGRLNTSDGRALLQSEFKASLNAINNNGSQIDAIDDAVEAAESDLINKLEKKYDQPIDEIIDEMDPDAFEELLGQLKVKLPAGNEVSLKEARRESRKLEKELELASLLVLKQLNGLAQQSDGETTGALRLGLESQDPGIKAESLYLLGERGEAQYASDIYPNLQSKHEQVKDAAFAALLASSEDAAREKLVEFLNPENFMSFVGGVSDFDGLQDMMGLQIGLVHHLAGNGDKYIDSIKKIAVNKDYDTSTRAFSLLALSLMTNKSAEGNVSSKTREKAVETLKQMSLKPTGDSREEKLAVSVFSTQLWAATKDSAGIGHALKLAGDKRLDAESQEDLLISVYEALQENTDELAEDENAIQHKILKLMKSSLPEAVVNETLEKLKPSMEEKLTSFNSLDTIEKQLNSELADQTLCDTLNKDIEDYRPILFQMLDHEESLVARMVSARIMGSLRDKSSVDRLIDRARNPLKGALNWKLERAYRGNPSVDGANIRLNAIASLGKIGDVSALPVTLDALDDPILQSYVLEPLAGLADDANKNADKADLERARKGLTKVMNSLDTSRAIRAARISAASTLFKFDGGVDAIKAFVKETNNPDFARHVRSALVSNDYALDPKHDDHELVADLLQPELGVADLHAQGLTGKGTEIAVIDGGYVDKTLTENFQKRVKLPASARSPEHYHPTMVASTAAGNGKIKGVAPDATIYSDKWPEFDGADPMDVYKKIIEGKLRGENNISVINNSWGFSNNNVLIFKDVRDILAEFKKVVDMAEKAGIQIVFSAGNSGEEPGIPSVGTLGLFGLDIDKLTSENEATLDYILDKVVLVGASNTRGSANRDDHELAGFSSIGDTLNNKLQPTVVGPGVDMMVYGWEGAGKNPKELVNGTSFSGPYVSALIALLNEANPNITPAQVRTILKSTAKKLKDVPVAHQGFGEVDPQAAVAAAKGLNERRTAKASKKAELPPPAADAKAAAVIAPKEAAKA